MQLPLLEVARVTEIAFNGMFQPEDLLALIHGKQVPHPAATAIYLCIPGWTRLKKSFHGRPSSRANDHSCLEAVVT
jgi:hypothetical protein